MWEMKYHAPPTPSATTTTTATTSLGTRNEIAFSRHPLHNTHQRMEKELYRGYTNSAVLWRLEKQTPSRSNNNTLPPDDQAKLVPVKEQNMLR